MQTISERPRDDVDLILWPEPPPSSNLVEDDGPSGAAAALAFVAFLSFAAGIALMALVLL